MIECHMIYDMIWYDMIWYDMIGDYLRLASQCEASRSNTMVGSLD